MEKINKDDGEQFFRFISATSRPFNVQFLKNAKYEYFNWKHL